MTSDPHVLFLYGNDEYAIARRLRELAPAFADPSQAEMNTAHLDAETMTEDQWSNAVNALPFLASHRLVVLRNPSRRYVGPRTRVKDRPALEAEHDDGTAAEALPNDRPRQEVHTEARQKFLDLLARVPPTTRLVITEVVQLRTKAEREAAEKHWLATWIKQKGLGLERHDLPPAGKVPGWIVTEAKAQGGQFAGAAAARLAEMVGNDTRQAAQEITKLLTYVNWSRPVTAADVEALSPLTAEPDVFAMVDDLVAGNTGRAQRRLHRLLEVQDSFGTWGMIVRQFRLLLVAREVLDNRGGEREMLEAMKSMGKSAQSYVAGKALGQARGFTMPRLEAIYHKLLEVDEAAKTGRMPLDLGMDIFVAELPAT